jgi:hypothetical protein
MPVIGPLDLGLAGCLDSCRAPRIWTSKKCKEPYLNITIGTKSANRKVMIYIIDVKASKDASANTNYREGPL